MSDSAPARAWYALVRETIALKGMTKAQLSELSGVPRPTIERWATGKRTPLPAPVNAVADVLGIERGRALRLAGIITTSPQDAEPEPLIPPDILASLTERFTPEEVEAIGAALEKIRRDGPAPRPGEEQEEAG